jgi:hypothetical protein
MTPTSTHPFSDLSPEQVHQLVQAAHKERSAAVRSFFASLFRKVALVRLWPERQREAQVWPPKSVSALRPTVYR